MRSTSSPYLFIRGKTYYFRYIFPSNLNVHPQRREIRRSMRTSALEDAIIHSHGLLLFCHKTKQLLRKVSLIKLSHQQKQTIHENIFKHFDAQIQEVNERIAFEPESISNNVTSIFAQNNDEFSRLIRDSLSLVPKEEVMFPLKEEVFPMTTPNLLDATIQAHLMESNPDKALLENANDEQLRPYFNREYGKALLQFGKIVSDLMEGKVTDEKIFQLEKTVPVFKEKKSVIKSDVPKFSEVWAEFVKTKTKPNLRKGNKVAWGLGTKRDYEARARDFLILVGDYAVDSYTDEQIDEYLSVLSALPAHRNKKAEYRDKSALELLEMDIPKADRLSASTREQHVKPVKSCFAYAKSTKDYITRNPLHDVVIPNERISYRPFSRDDLKLLFQHEDYVSGKHNQTWQFWLPLMALYTGTRQAELCQLRVEDFHEEDGVHFFHLYEYNENIHLKTENARRSVPVSAILIQLGLLRYVEALRKAEVEMLFPDLVITPGKSIGSAASRWFNGEKNRVVGFKEAAGVDLTHPELGRKTFHSFRTNAITEASSAGIPENHIKLIVGHDRKQKSGSTAIYEQLPVNVLFKAVQALNYGLDHSSLKGQWKRYVAIAKEYGK